MLPAAELNIKCDDNATCYIMKHFLHFYCGNPILLHLHFRKSGQYTIATAVTVPR